MISNQLRRQFFVNTTKHITANHVGLVSTQHMIHTKTNSLLRNETNCQTNNNILSRREFHVTAVQKDNLIYYGAGILALSIGAQQLYKMTKANTAAATQSSIEEKDPKSTSASSSTTTTPSSATKKERPKTSSTDPSKPASASTGFFGSFFARTFYDGGFEEKMTKREAALILGVRESSSAERIKDAHRRILLLNHPDRGGSAFIAAKVNEAKDLLMKGKQT